MKRLTILLLFAFPFTVLAQSLVKGRVVADGKPLQGATVHLKKINKYCLTDSLGFFEMQNLVEGSYNMEIIAVGFQHYHSKINVLPGKVFFAEISLIVNDANLDNVVVTGTMKAVSKSESPVPVEVYNNKFFQKNPTPSLFESISMINGVQAQLNCNICNTGDIHINGMEGPYTLVLIDGMPIVSGLSSVYGLSGIPNSIIERVEVVKGPAASLYGSDAMGGTINVITKSAGKAPLVSADIFTTSYNEYNVDASVKFSSKKVSSLLGINYFNFNNKVDDNNDGFTDVTLQNRISIFNKLSFKRKQDRVASLSARYVYEDRWGGQMSWSKKWRGTDSIYGESIYTKRVELIGLYQLPTVLPLFLQLSYNNHDQNSYYGKTPYMAVQSVAFAQLYFNKQVGKCNNLLGGLSSRYTVYDDNTTATTMLNGDNNAQKNYLPGLFIQDEIKLNNKNVLLAGYRLDHDKVHGAIQSPRVAYKFAPDNNHILRTSFGTGFRVVNVFTEDHAALTGARSVVFTEELKPEKSVNANINYVHKIHTGNTHVTLDFTAFYSYFSNKIIADYDTDPNYIFYDNLKGHAVSRGIALNSEMATGKNLTIMAGFTLMDVYQKEPDASGKPIKTAQLFAPGFTGNFLVSYKLPAQFVIDFTGKFNGPMRLPILPNDYRPEYSPWFCIANIQCKKTVGDFEVYGGIKNIFNFIPKDPIIRANDPFDKQANDPIQNPYGYTFDPSYNYSALQGAKGFLGIRYTLQK